MKKVSVSIPVGGGGKNGGRCKGIVADRFIIWVMNSIFKSN